MPAKAKTKPADAPVPEDEQEAEGPTEPEKKLEDPTAEIKKQLAAYAKTAAEQAKELKELRKLLPKPTEEQEKAKQEEERLAAVKAEQDEMLADYQETLAEKYHITEGVTSLAEARTIMKVAKANKLGLTTMAEQSKKEPAKAENKPIFDVSALLKKD